MLSISTLSITRCSWENCRHRDISRNRGPVSITVEFQKSRRVWPRFHLPKAVTTVQECCSSSPKSIFHSFSADSSSTHCTSSKELSLAWYHAHQSFTLGIPSAHIEHVTRRCNRSWCCEVDNARCRHFAGF